MARHADGEQHVERPLVRGRVLKLLLPLIALLAGCSSVLGFDDFKDTSTGSGVDAGSDSAAKIIYVDGTIISTNGEGIPNVGVEAFDRAGLRIADQVENSADGTFTIQLPVASGSVDGYLHFAPSSPYRDYYQHFPGPESTNLILQVPMLTDAEIGILAAQGNVSLVGNTGIMIVDTLMPNVTIQLDGGDIRYFVPGSNDISPTAAESSENQTAIVFNLADGIYKPHSTLKPEGRAYAVEPNTLAQVTIE